MVSPLATPKEVAELTGIDPKWIIQATRANQSPIAFLMVGKHPRFFRDDVHRYLRRRVPAVWQPPILTQIAPRRDPRLVILEGDNEPIRLPAPLDERTGAITIPHLDPAVFPKGEHVYLLFNRELFKIGITWDLVRRVSSIALQGGRHVYLIAAARSRFAHHHEKVLHQRYEGKRIIGEWFALDADDIDDIQDYMRTL